MSALRAGNLQIVPKKSENCRRCAPGDPPPDFPTHIEYVSAAFYSIQHGWPVRRGAVTRVYLHPPRLRPPGSGAPPRGCTARWHRGCALAADDASEGWARRSRAARRGCAAPATRLTTRCAACTTRCAAMLCSRASSVSGRDAAWAATSGSESMRLSGESCPPGVDLGHLVYCPRRGAAQTHGQQQLQQQQACKRENGPPAPGGELPAATRQHTQRKQRCCGRRGASSRRRSCAARRARLGGRTPPLLPPPYRAAARTRAATRCTTSASSTGPATERRVCCLLSCRRAARAWIART